MSQVLTDERLPENVTIVANDFNEFVATCDGGVVQIYKYGEMRNVRAGKSLDEAIDNYLNEVV